MHDVFETIKEKCLSDNRIGRMSLQAFLDIVDKVAEEYEDTCEWFKYDYRTIAPKNHDAEEPYWRIPDNMDKMKFCPYCGKRIEVKD